MRSVRVARPRTKRAPAIIAVPSAVPITPDFLQGFGKVLPRGGLLPVSFYCDVVIGEKLAVAASRRETMDLLEKAVSTLAETVPGAGAGLSAFAK